MAYDYPSIMQNQYERLLAEHAAASAELERARISGDMEAMDTASDCILVIDGKLEKLGARAQNMVNAAQSPQGTRHGYSDQMSKADVALASKYNMPEREYEVAVNWTATDMTHGRSMTLADLAKDKEERVKTYLENQKKYRALRDGGYRDELDERGMR